MAYVKGIEIGDNLGTNKNKTTTTQKKPKTSKNTATINTGSATKQSSGSTSIVAAPTNSNRDIGTEIGAELAKDKIDWGRVAGLTKERDSKIASGNMDVESTKDLIDRYYNQRGTNSAPSSDRSIVSDTKSRLAGTPNVMGVETIEPEPTFDPQDYIRELLAEQRRQQLAALESAHTKALTGLDTTKTGRQTALDTAKNNYLTNLDTALQSSMENISNEEAKIDPYYYDLRNQAQSASDVQAMNFAQYMAGRGIKGSAAGMPEIYRNAALQGQIGGLNRQQAANQSEIDRIRTTTQNQYGTNKANVLNNYEADLAGLENEYLTKKQGILDAYEQDRIAAQSGLDAQGLQAYIDQLNADRLFSLNEAGITGRYQGTPTLAGQEFQQNLDDKAKASYLDTIGRFSDNYQQEINNVQNDNDTTNDWQVPYLQAARQQKIQQQAEQTAAQAAAAGEAEKEQYKQAFDLWKAYGTATQDIASILGVPVGARTADFNIDSINAATSKKNADTAAKNAETAANKPKEQSASGYKTNPDYAEEVAFIISNPETALATIQQNATALIQKYGYDGYNELVRQATPKK